MAIDPFIGSDIKLTSSRDLAYNSRGDLELVGVTNPKDNMLQAVNLRLGTQIRTYQFSSTYGADLGQFVDEPITPNKALQIQSEVKTSLSQDPRIDTVNTQTSANEDSTTVQLTATTKTGVTVSTAIPIGG